VTEAELRLAVVRVRSRPNHPTQAVFQSALYLPSDELVLCLFESSSRAAVKRTSEAAGMPCERVIETVWIAPESNRNRSNPERTSS
jgi:hypothetical protein